MPLRIAGGFAAGEGSEITVSFRPQGWMPFGIFGLLGSGYARWQMEESFADRQGRLLRLLALEARVAATI